MNQPMLCGIYTLTPTHPGTGQASGAVDLPIAREVHTGLPVLPATSLKGVVRDWFGLPGDGLNDEQRALYKKVVQPLFGPLPPRRGEKSAEKGKSSTDGDDELAAGNLVFLEGMLLAMPVRSLRGVYRMVTSPLLVARLRRLLEAFEHASSEKFTCPEPEDGRVLLPKGQLGPVSLEDLVFPSARCKPQGEVDALASTLAELVDAGGQGPDAASLRERLVVVADDVLQDLSHRATNVAARIVLDPAKKTSQNLWYEESLPPDTLFATIIADRPDAPQTGGKTAVDQFRGWLEESRYRGQAFRTQIGGNVTVGQGFVRFVRDVGRKS